MNMNCKHIHDRLDDYLDGELSPTERAEVEHHLQQCADCRQRLQTEQNLRAELRELPVTPYSSGFTERALRQAVEQNAHKHHRHGFATGFGSALVAGLALWVVVGLFPGEPEMGKPEQAPLLMVAVTLNQPQQVALLIDAENGMHNARIAIELPDNVALAGFPGRKRLEWTTDLAKGSNLLKLPVIATQGEGGRLIARIEHDNKVRTLTIQLQVKQPQASEQLDLPLHRSA